MSGEPYLCGWCNRYHAANGLHDLFEDDEYDDEDWDSWAYEDIIDNAAFEEILEELRQRFGGPGRSTPPPRTPPKDVDSRVDKLMRMARQNVSPNERDIARNKLRNMGLWPEGAS